MSHLISENKSIYFLIRFAQTKITLFFFVNNWVIRENESFLLVEPCSCVPKSISIYPSFTLSHFHLPCHFESLPDSPLYSASEAPSARKLCSPQFLQSRFTAFRTFIKFFRILLYKIGLFIYLFSFYLFIYLFIYFVHKLNFCLYVSL